MTHAIIEIKARCPDAGKVRAFLRERGADFRGVDRQTDTYFRVPNGRLKLREGNIENNLIYYLRPNQAAPKQSLVHLCPVQPGSNLKETLTTALGVLVVVVKQREIYFIDNVKFHIDTVDGLGEFVEIEAIGPDGEAADTASDRLRHQCDEYMRLLGTRESDLIDRSYSDLLLAGTREK